MEKLKDEFGRFMRDPITALADAQYKLAYKRRRSKAYSHNLGVLAIMKNESANICEWIEHYRWQAADRIYLIDNGSTDDTLQLIEPYIRSGFVVLSKKPDRWLQNQHYRRMWAEQNLGANCRWIAVADVDEFWFRPDGVPLGRALGNQAYCGTDLIYSNWRMFGSSGLEQHPPSIRAAFHSVWPDLAIETKWIVRTAAIRHPIQLRIHKVDGVRSTRTISDNQTLQLNHYAIQSLDFFKTVKMTRGDADTRASETIRDMDYFRSYDARATETDTTLADLLAASAKKEQEIYA